MKFDFDCTRFLLERLTFPKRKQLMPSKPAILVGSCALALIGLGMDRASFSLIHAEPAAGGVFSEPPTRIRLIFSEPLDASSTQVSLSGVGGQTIKLAAAIDPRLVDAILAPVPPLNPGAYQVEWRVVSARGLSLAGKYAFAFGAGASLPPSGDNDSASALDQRGARSKLTPQLQYGIALVLAVALMFLIWIRRRSRGMS